MLTKHASFLFTLLFLFTGLTACSLYQSEGRKFLEKNALTFAATGLSSVTWSFQAYQIEEPCAELVEAPYLNTSEWSLLEDFEATQVHIYQSELTNEYDVLAYFKHIPGRHFLCAFEYTSLQHRIGSLDRDLNLAYQIIDNLAKY